MMAGSAETEMALLRNDIANHTKSDDERYQRIDTGLNKIDNTITAFIAKMDQSIQRVYTVMDERTNTLQDDITNVESIARAEAKLSLGLAQDAHDKIAEVEKSAGDKIADVRMWVMMNVIVAAVGIIGILAEHFFFGKP